MGTHVPGVPGVYVHGTGCVEYLLLTTEHDTICQLGRSCIFWVRKRKTIEDVTRKYEDVEFNVIFRLGIDPQSLESLQKMMIVSAVLYSVYEWCSHFLGFENALSVLIRAPTSWESLNIHKEKTILINSRKSLIKILFSLRNISCNNNCDIFLKENKMCQILRQ